MLQESDPYYLVLGGSTPGIKRSPPQLSDGDVSTVVVKVADLHIAERLQSYQDCFAGDVRQSALAISAAVDCEGVFYPVFEGAIKGSRIRMILTDPQDAVALMQSHRRRKYQRVDSFRDAVKYMLARGDRQLIAEYGVTPWELPKKRNVPRANLLQQASSRQTGLLTSDAVTFDPASPVIQRSPSAMPASVPEIDDLVGLTQSLSISLPVTTAGIPAASDVDTSAGGVQSTPLGALGAITRSAAMVAFGAGAAFTYLSL
ncbi:hypothetical protein DXG01_011054 [Tephrocybe rancida]|nr:hypothetical protein DXG01_011054 [Tephrocybe rancida]